MDRTRKTARKSVFIPDGVKRFKFTSGISNSSSSESDHIKGPCEFQYRGTPTPPLSFVPNPGNPTHFTPMPNSGIPGIQVKKEVPPPQPPLPTEPPQPTPPPPHSGVHRIHVEVIGNPPEQGQPQNPFPPNDIPENQDRYILVDQDVVTHNNNTTLDVETGFLISYRTTRKIKVWKPE